MLNDNEKIIDRNYHRILTVSVAFLQKQKDFTKKKQKRARIPPFLSSHNAKTCKLGSSFFRKPETKLKGEVNSTTTMQASWPGFETQNCRVTWPAMRC